MTVHLVAITIFILNFKGIDRLTLPGAFMSLNFTKELSFTPNICTMWQSSSLIIEIKFPCSFKAFSNPKMGMNLALICSVYIYKW